jgi:hypothetical protein
LIKLLNKFLGLDRRVIFIIVGAAVVVPFIIPLGLGVTESPPVERVYDFIEEGAEEDPKKPVLLSVDYDPSTQPELSPMAEAILIHCFRLDIPVIITCLNPGGPGLALEVSNNAAEMMNAEYGEDYVFLGYSVGGSVVMLSMGENIRQIFPTDYYGTPVDEYPIMEGIENYDDIHLVICLSGSTFPEFWVAFAHERYGANVAAGVTAVMAADYYPFLQTGQMVGLLGGLKGAAEYEKLIGYEDMFGRLGNGIKGMDAQTVIHLFIVVIVILGNIAYAVNLRHERKESLKS